MKSNMRLQCEDKYRAGADVVLTITKRLYSPLGGVILNHFGFLFFSKREYLLTVA